MRRIVVIAVLVLAMMAIALPASAHNAGPCGDEDTGTSGRAYAQHHIVPLAKAGIIGTMHKPGTHRGFSVCLGVHGD